MTITKVSYSMIRGSSINVLDFGADPTGVADSTLAINAAVTSQNGNCAIYFPTGTYLITSTITFAYDRYFVYGNGATTKINFVPTANDDCFVFDKGSTVSYQSTIRDITFYSTDTTYDKRAIVLVDVSTFVLDNIQTIYPHWSGGGAYSTFLRIKGRELTSIRNLNVSADQPIDIYPIPAPHTASGIGIDHFHFQDCYLVCMKAAKSIVFIADGVDLTYVTFDGYQAWIGGNYGLYWNDTTTIGVSIALTLKNIRWESQGGTTGYFVYIRHNYSLQQLLLENIYGAAATNGFYFSKVTRANLKQCFYIGTQNGISIDSTCSYFNFDNVFLNNPSATVSVLSKGNSGTYLAGGSLVTCLPAPASGEGISQSINPEPNNGYARFAPNLITVLSSTAIKLCESGTSSLLFIIGDGPASAIFQIKGSNHAVALLLTSDASFWGGSIGAQRYNIYWDGAKYVLQNNTAGSAVFSILTIG